MVRSARTSHSQCLVAYQTLLGEEVMTNKDDSARIEDVLSEVRRLKDKYEEFAAITGESFNVFSVLGVETSEVKHSSFLAELLNPEGSHRQGEIFLKHFLNLEYLRLSGSFSHGDLEDFQVEVEAYRGDYGRIDILLEHDDAYIIHTRAAYS